MTVATETSTSSSVFHRTLTHAPLLIERAEGNYLYAVDGRRILDGSGGAAVVSVGHARPEIVRAVTHQLATVPYLNSATFAHGPGEELARMLCDDSGMARALFLSGGSEAIESAIKLCRQYHVENKEPQRVKYIARRVSYHGNTLGALGIGRHSRRRALYLPIMANDIFHEISPCNAYRYRFDDESDESYVARLANELDEKFRELGPESVSAFICEPVVGAAAGCVPFVPGYLAAMRAVCHAHGALFVCDEIMCGFGRTGKLHAWQWEGDDARPDVQALGKGLNGGYSPLSALLISQRIVDVFSRGSGAFANGFTFQSSAVGCAAGLACYKYIQQHNLVEQCRLRGVLMSKLLKQHLLSHPHVGDIRGMGLFWGIELVQDKATKVPFPYDEHISDKITAESLSLGVAVYSGTGSADGWDGDHIMLCPPYTITEDEVEMLVNIVTEAIYTVLGK